MNELSQSINIPAVFLYCKFVYSINGSLYTETESGVISYNYLTHEEDWSSIPLLYP